MRTELHRTGIKTTALLLGLDALSELTNPDFTCDHDGPKKDCFFIYQGSVCSNPENEGNLCTCRN